MKRIICILIMLGSLPGPCDAAPELMWTQHLGPSNASAQAYAVSIDEDRDVYVAGRTEGHPIDGEEDDRENPFLIRFSPTGELEWERYWGAEGWQTDQARGVAVVTGGVVFVAGDSSGDYDGIENPKGYPLTFLSRFSTTGAKAWSRLWGDLEAFDPTTITLLHDLVAVDASAVYTIGETSGEFGSQTNAGSYDFCVCKASGNGNREWVRIWGSASSDTLLSGAADPSGNLIVGGRTYSPASGFDGQTNPSPSKASACITKLTPDGDRAWSRVWGSDRADVVMGLAVDASGGIYAVGETDGWSFTGVTNTMFGGVFLTKWSPNGDFEWTKMLSNNGVTDELGRRRLRYSAYHDALFLTGNLLGYGVSISRIALNGEIEWQVGWGMLQGDYAQDIGVSVSGEIYVVGDARGDIANRPVPSGERWIEITKWIDTVGVSDSDQDGLPDSWELGYFGGLTQDGAGDADGDGAINLDERLAATSPTDPTDVLSIGVKQSTTGGIELSWISKTGRTYTVFSSEDAGRLWTNDFRFWEGTGGLISVTNSTPRETRFFRIHCQEP